jgi:hypothetical protein
MLQVARLAPSLLGDAGHLVVQFIQSQGSDDGGFRGRSERSDLYYTVFAMEGLAALGADVPLARVEPYLRSFGDGDGLDLVHLACLARCWASFPPGEMPQGARDGILHRIESHRSGDGGCNALQGAERGTVYGCFLARGAYQDLQAEMPDAAGLVRCVRSLRLGDGSYANEANLKVGSTATTSAAIMLLRSLGADVGSSSADWLQARCDPRGGFHATAAAPIPDLLSTATALHALAAMHVSLDSVRDPCLDFLDSLWSARGAFRGNWLDDALDCEYTYYGLLAAGHLCRGMRNAECGMRNEER